MKKRDFLKVMPVWMTPAVLSVTLPAHAQTSAPSVPPSEPPEPPKECEWAGSSLTLTEGTLCNTGDADACAPLKYEIVRVYHSPGGGEPVEDVVEVGEIAPLAVGECYTFSLPIALVKHCLRVYQENGHPGIGYTQYCWGV